MKVISVNTSKKQEVIWKNKKIVTGIFKKPVPQISVKNNEVEGDAIVDTKHHGGELQAVYAYGFQHYSYWQKLYPEVHLNHGIFGENITVSDLDETQLNVGDVYKVGTTVLEVTKSRQPCMKLGVVFGTQAILKQFWNSTKCGVYFKIIQEGIIQPNDEFTLVKKAENTPTIAAVYTLKRKEKGM